MSSQLAVKKSTPTIGAEVSGIDLSDQISGEQAEQIRSALLEHKVIFFRDQNLDPRQQIDFARIFGELEPPHPIFPGVPEAEQVTILEHDESKPPQENEYHTDVTWREQPALGSVLHALEVPEIGGDTIWVDLQAVYASMAQPVQEMLGKLEAWNSIEVFSNSLSLESGSDPAKLTEILKLFPPQKHPVVRTHPETGRNGIFVNRIFTTRIDDVSRWESNNILNMIYQIAERPEFQVRFTWQKGSVAVWDNRCTHHYAVGDYFPNYRKMHRVTIKGDKPGFQSRNESAKQAAE